MNWARTSIRTVRGPAAVSWTRVDDRLRLSVRVPGHCSDGSAASADGIVVRGVPVPHEEWEFGGDAVARASQDRAERQTPGRIPDLGFRWSRLRDSNPRPTHYEPDRDRAGLFSAVVPDPVFPDQSTCRGPAAPTPCCTVQRRPRSLCAPLVAAGDAPVPDSDPSRPPAAALSESDNGRGSASPQGSASDTDSWTTASIAVHLRHSTHAPAAAHAPRPRLVTTGRHAATPKALIHRSAKLMSVRTSMVVSEDSVTGEG
ncbi:hypothetical protein M2164_003921 [Streptomyces sp. SAI-208]|nr:hypothetical protein [Streptomyces sp. SAI-208]